MDDTKEYIVKDATSYLDGRFKDVEVIAEGDDVGIYPKNFDLCKKMLPMIEELDKKARNLLPHYFMIPDSVFEAWIDSSCWTLDYIVFGRISHITDNLVKGFVMSYIYDPPNSISMYDCFYIKVKFIENGHPIGFEFGSMF